MRRRTLPSPKFELPPQVLALSVGHLQLSERVRLALKEHETISGLVTAIESKPNRWSKSVRSEILLVLDQLTGCLQFGLEKGWDQFRSARRKMTRPMVIYFASFALDRMHRSVQELPIGTLHMRGRAKASLSYANIKTVGDLIQSARRGLSITHPAGLGACLKIIDMLEAISQAGKDNGECVWDNYADSQHIILLPCQQSREFVVEKYLEAFPKIVQKAAYSQFGEYGLALMREYLMCAAEQQVPLIRIGDRFGMAPSTASHVRDNIVSKLRAAFLCDNYTGCRFRFRSEFTLPIRRLGKELLRTPHRIIPYAEWSKIIKGCWSTKLDGLGPIERGILEILGFELITFDQPRLRPVIVPLGRKAGPIRKAIIKAERLLTHKFVSGVSKSELFGALQASSDKGELNENDLVAIIRSLRGVHQSWSAQKNLLLSTNCKTLANSLEQALRAKGRPIHVRQLTRLINQRTSGIKRRRVFEGVLSADKRFAPTIRTGYWSLTEWGQVEVRTIAELATAFLSRHRRPVRQVELFEWISGLRPVRSDSVRRILREGKQQFSEVAPRTWAIAGLRAEKTIETAEQESRECSRMTRSRKHSSPKLLR